MRIVCQCVGLIVKDPWLRSLSLAHVGAALLLLAGLLFSGPSLLLAQELSIRSAASYGELVAPGGLAALFGAHLAPRIVSAKPNAAGRLPVDLGGIRVDVEGRFAVLSFVSPTQINFVIPEETPLGSVRVVVSSAEGGVIASGIVEVRLTAPGLFSMDSSGTGAGAILNGTTFAIGPFQTETSETPGCDKRTRLAVFGTGLRFAGNPTLGPAKTNAAASVRAVVEGASISQVIEEIEFAGATEDFPGLDQLNLILPAELDGAGELSLRVTAEGVESNAVTFTVEALSEETADCVADGLALVYNTVADLLGGDLWDQTVAAEVAEDVSQAPSHWPLMGVGTTAEAARNGEVIAFGTAGAPELIWADPEFPPTVHTLTEQPIPFVGVAAGNPDSAFVAAAQPGRPIHEQIVELAGLNKLAFAGIRVSGRFFEVSYSVAHNLLKQGTPLTDPAVDKAPFQLFFTADREAAWELSGFYAASAGMQGIVSVVGAPVHLHGFQLDRSRAGHIGSATVEQAETRVYPLSAPIVSDADLMLSNVAAADSGLLFEVVIRGGNSVARTTVQGLVGDEVLFQLELFSLPAQSARPLIVSLPAGKSPDSLRIIVDPFNDVRESDELNNVFYLLLIGW